MTKERESMLSVAQRRMLRRIVQVPRWVDKDWVHYIVRSTHAAEQLIMEGGVPNWIQEQRRRKWWWAGHCKTFRPKMDTTGFVLVLYNWLCIGALLGGDRLRDQ